MSLSDRIDNFQRRYPKSGFPLAVAYKFFDDQGGYLAALITYYGFISLFPLLLVLTSVLGFVLEDNPDLQERIVDSALSQIPVVGEQLGESGQLSGSSAAVTIGVVSAIYGALGVSVAIQNAMNIVWAVPRNERPNPIRVRIKGSMLLSTVGLAVIGLTVLNGVTAAIDLGGDGRVLAMLGSLILYTAVFVVGFRFGTARPVSIRDVFPGALAAAVGWQVLQTFGSVFVQRVIANASATNGVFAVVLGLLAFLYLAAVMVVICLEFNAVRVDGLYPRSLLTPFTDNVVLMPGDEAAYSAQAQAQRSKGFQEIDVSFDNPASGTTPEHRDPEDDRTDVDGSDDQH
ncbi:YihY/virulence factor BrkB family protein [Gordonia hankookensis]|uniref:YihY/virulence factor BrkB family protein n=1 Tax=Gordonia hankookensis TaxID=589403 RepID=A0ABR7WHB9_9ACTN|nr:YihY/virulence factor BrkB family protein [Gordonia hankookensis]MBD1322160.1 YihY/virulence factor BrkB family protein [Gordonia hankookensis]